MNAGKVESEQAIKLSQALQQLRETYDLRMELSLVVAQEARANYNALMDAGFTDAQAMQLLCAKEQRK